MYAAGNRSDVPALFAMAACYFSFRLFAILRPAALRNAMDNFANAWKQGSWHPYKMRERYLNPILPPRVGSGKLVA